MSKKKSFIEKIFDIYDKNLSLIKEEDQEKILGRVLLVRIEAEKGDPLSMIELAIIMQLINENENAK